MADKIESGEAVALAGPPPSPDSLTKDYLAGLRAEVEKWVAFEPWQAIDEMTDEQEADYRAFLMAVFNHATASIDYVDKSHLKVVK